MGNPTERTDVYMSIGDILSCFSSAFTVQSAQVEAMIWNLITLTWYGLPRLTDEALARSVAASMR